MNNNNNRDADIILYWFGYVLLGLLVCAVLL